MMYKLIVTFVVRINELYLEVLELTRITSRLLVIVTVSLMSH